MTNLRYAKYGPDGEQIDDPSLEIPAPQFSTDTSGNVTGLVAPGGVGIPIGNPLNTVIALGDSMTHRINAICTITGLTRTNGIAYATTAGDSQGTGQYVDVNNCVDTTFNVRNARITRIDSTHCTFPCQGPDGSTTNITNRVMLMTQRSQFRDDAYWVHLQSKFKGALTLVRNAGVSSNRSDEVLARVAADVIAYQSAWVFFQITLYNDVVNAGYTATQIINYNALTLAKLLGAGRKVLLIGPPGLSTTGGNTTARVQTYHDVMDWMRLQAQTLPNVYYADTWNYSVDPMAATKGSPRAGYLETAAIHESPIGAERKAQAIYDAIGNLIPRVQCLVSSNADNITVSSANSNIWEWGPWANSGGTVVAPVTGVACGGIKVDATNTSGTLVVAASANTRSDGYGYDQRLVFTTVGTGDYARIYAVTSVVASRWTEGQILRPVLEMNLSGLATANLQGINISINFAGAKNVTCYSLASIGPAFPTTDGVFTHVGPDIVIPGDTLTSLQYIVQFLFAGAGSNFTADVGRMSLRKYAAPTY